MKQVSAVWLPDEEQEITKFLLANTVDGVGTYQRGKLLAALAFTKQFRTCLDIGAHCGTWAMQLVPKFKTVHCFEPVARHRECLVLNAPKAIVHACALGVKQGKVKLAKGIKSTGDTCIDDEGEYESDLKTLDSFAFKDVDFIKIDCEGYELFVLQGGEQTILRERPTLIVEQKKGHAIRYGIPDTAAVKWLIERGFHLRGQICGDYILTPE